MTFLRDLLFPPKCAACNRLLPHGTEREQEVLCDACSSLWESERLETCGVCAKRIGECYCMPLAMQKAKITAFAKTVYYDPAKSASAPNRILYRIKKQRNNSAECFLASSMWEVTERMIGEERLASESLVITYLPRAHSARLEFGTDQAEVLAKRLSQMSGIPMQALICRNLFQNNKQKNNSLRQSVFLRLLPRGRCRSPQSTCKPSRPTAQT